MPSSPSNIRSRRNGSTACVSTSIALAFSIVGAGAGVTLPRSLAPHLYDGTFRIAECSERLWNFGVQQRAAAGRAISDEWPLQAVSVMDQYIAKGIITTPGFTEMTDVDIKMAVGYSDLVEYDGACAELNFTPDRGNLADTQGTLEDGDV